MKKERTPRQKRVIAIVALVFFVAWVSALGLWIHDRSGRKERLIRDGIILPNGDTGPAFNADHAHRPPAPTPAERPTAERPPDGSGH
jgi:hypothetical protein